MSNGGGNLDRMSADSSSITSAEDFPPPPDWRGRVNKMLSNNWGTNTKNETVFKLLRLSTKWLSTETQTIMPKKKIIRSALSARIYNKRLTGVTHLLSLLLVLCNVGILMKTKHFWVRYERQFPDVVHVCLVISLGRCVICTTIWEPLLKEPQKITITLIMYIPHSYSFKIFRLFWLARIPRLILHNQPALTTFEKCKQCIINSMVYCILVWKHGWLGNSELLKKEGFHGYPKPK